MNQKGRGRGRSWPNLRYYPKICLDIGSVDNRPPSHRIDNRVPVELSTNLPPDLITGIHNSAACQENGIRSRKTDKKYQCSVGLGVPDSRVAPPPAPRVYGDPIYSAVSGTKHYHQKYFKSTWSVRGSTVVKVLCYKSEGRWVDLSWCYWNFSLT